MGFNIPRLLIHILVVSLLLTMPTLHKCRGQRIQAITFDALGTLLYLDRPLERLCDSLQRVSMKVPVRTVREAFVREAGYYRRHHLEGKDADRLYALRCRCANVFFECLKEEGYDAALSQAQRVEALMASIRFQLYNDVPSVLKWCSSKKLAIGVISNWDSSLEKTLSGFLPGHGFDCFVISACEGIAKPDPSLFQRAARNLEIRPDIILHVGDEIDNDLKPARRAGFQAALMDREKKHTRKNCLRIQSLSDLPHLLPNLHFP